MKEIRQEAMALASLSIYKGILERTVPGAFYRLLWSVGGSEQEFLNAWGAFFAALCDRNGSDNFTESFTETALFDENAFSLTAASGRTDFAPSMRSAAERDLGIIRSAASITPEKILAGCGFEGLEALALPLWKTGEPAEPFRGAGSLAENLADYYRKNGCGMFASYRAFIWRGGKITPVAHPDPTRMEDLKGYEEQRGMAVDNTLAFLNGLPANNCLLYGDRGTGKSSTVKALLNEYYPKGLRMIEMPKESLSDFPSLVDQIAGLPMKFVIFIDDLSFSRQDDTYASLKAVLEGGLAARPENTLIYATSNRKHLLRETFSDREGDEIHRGDTIQESLSLADRFGLSISFSLPDKKEFLMIVRRLAGQRGLKVELPQLEAGAERWAIGRGGRSPRCAKQYVRFVEARVRRGLPLD